MVLSCRLSFKRATTQYGIPAARTSQD